MYSKDGEPETFVPPVNVSRTGISDGNFENKTYGKVAWRVNPMLPTVSHSTRVSYTYKHNEKKVSMCLINQTVV
jgi:hypothetical protein